MTPDQIKILAILAATVGMFVWGRFRHDVVAIGSLIACVLVGLVEAEAAFAGFGHPAVITVASVLVLSRGLQTSGAVDAAARRFLPDRAGPTLTIGLLTGMGALLSAFMNNIGALALLMPVALQVAAKQNLPPGRVLMPLAFGSVLGGVTTLIGTPANLIVSAFREQTGAGSYQIFDFSPVGVAVAGAGVLFVASVGWRLVPVRERAGAEGFDTGAYITEARITKESPVAGKSLREIGPILTKVDAQVVGLVRNSFRVIAPHAGRILKAGDLLVIEADPKSLASALLALGLKLEEDAKEKLQEKPAAGASGEAPLESEGVEKPTEKKIEPSEIVLLELAVRPDAPLVGRSATEIRLRSRFSINLLALSRQGRRMVQRLRSEAIQAGDVLLMQGTPEAVAAFAAEFGCVPLAERSIRIPDSRQAILAASIMAAAVALPAFGLLPAAISFAGGVLVFMLLQVVPVRTVYESIDWSVIVLLAALIPVADAMGTTGAADWMSQMILSTLAPDNPTLIIILMMAFTMTLSDFMNNAATAAVMCPIALSTAEQLQVNPDSLLMTVAIGASCSFLTPIGHQNNTLILGPGGFRFGDYWRLGLPLEIIIIAVSLPLLLIFWPL